MIEYNGLLKNPLRLVLIPLALLCVKKVNEKKLRWIGLKKSPLVP